MSDTIKVYPNFSAISAYALLAKTNRLGQLGVRRQPRRGDGLDFHQLREYRAGDSLRQIEWKTSARQHKLIAKEYQESRDQQVIFLLDCGRRMRSADGLLSHFDHSLNALLLLAHVALKQGDALGLLTFSGDERWLSPRKGKQTVAQLLQLLYDVQPSLQSSDYVQAAQNLLSRSHKRSLVILVSNLRHEDQDALQAAVKLLKRKHLVLCVSLQEPVLYDILNAPIEDFDAALQYVGVSDYLHQQTQIKQKIEQTGVLYLQTTPNNLPVSMVNQYWAVKKSGRL